MTQALTQDAETQRERLLRFAQTPWENVNSLRVLLYAIAVLCGLCVSAGEESLMSENGVSRSAVLTSRPFLGNMGGHSQLRTPNSELPPNVIRVSQNLGHLSRDLATEGRSASIQDRARRKFGVLESS